MDPLANWAQGIRLLIGIIVATITIAILVVGGWVFIRSLIFWIRQRRSLKHDDQNRRDEHGRSRPPRGAGICDACQGAFQSLNYFEGNRRLCDECHRATANSISRKEAERTLPSHRRGLHAGAQAGRNPEDSIAC